MKKKLFYVRKTEVSDLKELMLFTTKLQELNVVLSKLDGNGSQIRI